MNAAGRLDPLELLTLDEVAAITKWHRRTVERKIGRGELRAVKLGRSTRVPRAELERYLTAAGATMPPNLTPIQGGKP